MTQPIHPLAGTAPAQVLSEEDLQDLHITYGFTGDYEDMARVVESKVLEKIAAAPAAAPAGWKLVPVQVPDSAFPWVSGGYSTDYRALDPRDQKIIEERAQRTWAAILDGIAAAPAAPAPSQEEAEIGMAWYNSCTEAERAKWHGLAGSAVPADAYLAFQAAQEASAAFAAPVVLPEPDFWVRPGSTIHPDRGWQCWSNDGTATGAYHADTVRALLAGVSAPVVQPYTDGTPQLHVGDSSFESWYSTYDPARKGDKQRARDAYAAGMGDPLVTAAPAADAPTAQGLIAACRDAMAEDAAPVALLQPDFTLDGGETCCFYESTVRALLAGVSATAADATQADARDKELLDFVEANAVTVEKEWEGPWQALVYGESESPSIIEDGKTAREALRAAIAAQAAQKGRTA